MIVFLWVVGAILIAAVMVFTTYASTVGGIGALSASRYERCPRCGHHGLVTSGQLHPGGCPPSTATRFAHACHLDARGLRHRHH